ncbi:MAG: phosphatase [Rhodobacterales bacterium]|nr:MAG: phosphatase [Rhodobacterales bacterium]
MNHVEGDLIALAKQGAFDVIVHGCNCFGTMGAGIARAISAAWPEALGADKATPLGDHRKLGTISVAEVGPLTIVNAYTQFEPAGPMPLADTDAIGRAFTEIATRFPTARIGYPLIGAGLAGGDWSDIAPIIDARLAGCNHTLVTLPGARP